jgi:hypothetical protein
LRQPITVEVASFDLREIEPVIDSAVDAFAQYIAQIPRNRTTRSKYGLLGPAGKAITELKAGRCDRDSLIGYTLRTQENTRGQFATEPALSAIDALERAVDQILKALRMTPEPMHPTVLDRLDYGLYYRLRRAQLESKEEATKEWRRFLESKYTSAAALNEAWESDGVDVHRLMLPSRQAPKGKTRSKAEQADVEAFYLSRISATSEED